MASSNPAQARPPAPLAAGPEGATRPSTRLTWRRTGAFTVVGIIGIGVRLAVLWLLVARLGVHYLAATFLAVEASVFHNFVWHVHWTWADRPASSVQTFWRLVRFHVTNGLVSIVGGVLLVSLLTGVLGIHYMLANVLAILTCALVNLIVANLWVFRPEWQRAGLGGS
jgi:dolichol-phosphate mannosyltransferase